MRAHQVARSLREARLALGKTQKSMAERVGVSPRLWAEVERGERPNVSLDSALRMLHAVGLRVRLEEPTNQSSAAAGLAARAAHRRATWTGGRARLGEDDEPRVDELSADKRLAAVAVVSQLAYSLKPPVARGAAAKLKRPAGRRGSGA